MKKQLLAILFLSIVTIAANAQALREEHEKPTPSVKHEKINTSRLNEGKYVKNLWALKNSQSKVKIDSVRVDSTSHK